MTEIKKGKKWLLTGGILGLLAVMLGAFGAHGIEEAIPEWYGPDDLPTSSSGPADSTDSEANRSEPKTLESAPEWYSLDQLHQKKLKTWITGVRYQFYHTVPILLIGAFLVTGRFKASRLLDLSGWLFVAGIAGFSGSIYLYILSKIKIFGMTAALGGVLLVCAWLFFVLGIVKSIPHENEA